jgi:hypothetical protein
VRMILLVALGSAVAVSSRAQAPDAASTQPASVVRVEGRTMSRPGGSGMSMSDVTFHFFDGTQLSAKEAFSSDWIPGAAPREFILSGDVRLKLTDKSAFLR